MVTTMLKEISVSGTGGHRSGADNGQSRRAAVPEFKSSSRRAPRCVPTTAKEKLPPAAAHSSNGAAPARLPTTARDDLPSHSELDELCLQLMELQAKRKFWIGIINKQTNAAGAYVRRVLGWNGEMTDEADEKVKTKAAKIKTQAAAIVSAVLAGKDVKDNGAALNAAMAILPLREALKPAIAAREAAEKEMKAIAKRLPAHQWQKQVHGLGELGLAVIVGECGNLASYSRDGLRKRLGLAPYEGKALSRWRTDGGLTADQWTDAGYSPRRRAQIHGVVTDPMFRAQAERVDKETGELIRAPYPYGAIYYRRREWTALSHPEWKPIQSHMDALRVMTQKVVCDLRVAWLAANDCTPSTAIPIMPPAD
jgi:hypothetical protein